MIVAVPVPFMRAALLELRPHLQPAQVVFDVGSVKVLPEAAFAEILGDAIPWCGTHPLFGPVSLALAERPLRVVLCPASAHAGAAEQARALYERIGCEVIVQTFEGHDRVMAHTHALTFFVAKGMIDAGAATDVPFAPASFQAIARTIETVRADGGHLFSAIARDNPFASEATCKEPVRALATIERRPRRCEGGQRANDPLAQSTAFAIPRRLQGQRSPELKQARDHIDAIDTEIVRLLAQRMQLAAARGARAAALGAPVLDGSREAEIIAARKDWAASSKIDPDGVADVFRAILTMSRRGQR